MANYGKSSPWYNTAENFNYLDILSIRPVPAEDDDEDYVIENQYKHRPDLLAFDFYGDSKLWWVFVQRNMSVIKDPVYDFEPGVTIKIPKKNNLQRFMGS
jgi:hypothetical protein